MSENNSFQALGKPVNGPSKKLERFPKPPNVTEVKFTSEELTAFCPVTNQPDFYLMELEFEPDKFCVESKSLKLYLWSFREDCCFAEALAGQMVDDIMAAISPRYCKVTLHQKVRGGLQLSATAERHQ